MNKGESFRKIIRSRAASENSGKYFQYGPPKRQITYQNLSLSPAIY